MNKKNDLRLYIGLGWIISFFVLWIIFNFILPQKDFEIKLNNIEESVIRKDWISAKKSMDELKSIYNNNRISIQSNNATEILTTFNYTMGQLDVSIQNEQDASLEYIGGLRSSLEYVMESFSGP